jgi:hypothetical protein
MKKSIVFVDHSFHKWTLSSVFFREILRENFNIIDIWDDSWNGGKGINIEERMINENN